MNTRVPIKSVKLTIRQRWGHRGRYRGQREDHTQHHKSVPASATVTSQEPASLIAAIRVARTPVAWRWEYLCENDGTTFFGDSREVLHIKGSGCNLAINCIAHYRIAHYRIAHTTLPIPHCPYRIAHTTLPIPHCPYRIAHTALPIPYCFESPRSSSLQKCPGDESRSYISNRRWKP